MQLQEIVLVTFDDNKVQAAHKNDGVRGDRQTGAYSSRRLKHRIK